MTDESVALGVDHASARARADQSRRLVIYGMNYAPEFAGIGRYTGEIAEHFAAMGVDVTVVTAPPHYPGWRVRDGYANRFSRRREGGVRVVRAPLLLRENMNGLWRLLAPLSFSATSAPLIVWEILARRPSIVICLEPTLFAAPAAIVAAKLTGARVVLYVQDLEVDAAFAMGHLGNSGVLKSLGYAFERLTMRGCDRIITISNRMAERLREKGVTASKVAVLRNWVDVRDIFPLDGSNPYRAELGLEDQDFVVLYSGNIGAKQGLDVLLRAAELLERTVPRVKFIIAGEGPAKTALRKTYGRLSNVRFLPFQPKGRLNEFLNLPDLHALPQNKDAADLVLPSKLGGMLASGKRVIVTAEKGTELADFLASAAILVPPGDAVKLAEAIARQCEDTVDDGHSVRLALSRTIAKDVGIEEFGRLVLG